MNILILGGASGLGEAITKKLTDNPENKIFFTFANSESNARLIEKEYSTTEAIKCDFHEPDSIKLLLEKIADVTIDILILNAYTGRFLTAHFQKIEANEFSNDFEYNLLPIIKISQEIIKKFRKRKQGKIITILSAALDKNPPIGSSLYVANKAHLKKLTQIWAIENNTFNITSNSISPSFMLTKMTSDTDVRIIQQLIDNHPLKKLLTVEEVADTVSFLTTASTHINGIDIIMNAGV